MENYIIKHSDSNAVQQVNRINDGIAKHKNVFIFFFLEGCGPCERTKPEWEKIENMLKTGNRQNHTQPIVVAEVDQALFSHFKNAGSQPTSFPSIRFIKGTHVEQYDGERTCTAFVHWINSKAKKQQKTRRRRIGKRRQTRRNRHRSRSRY